jgi:hypothetical protein
MTIDVYLLECQTWSDGEDEHEEDHNYYYDLKYFYVSRSYTGHVIFAWKAKWDDMTSGILMSAENPLEMLAEKHVGTIGFQEVESLVFKELTRLKKNNNKEDDNIIKSSEVFLLNNTSA